MRIAIFSDIHSNLEALEAVLEDMDKQRVDGKICLGDIVGYSANPAECVDRVAGLAIPTLLGNHDQVCTMKDPLEGYNDLAKEGIAYSRRHLEAHHLKFLRRLPMTHEFDGVTYVHSSLHQPEAWVYVLSYHEAALNFSAQKTAVAFCGHTHQPVIFEQNRPMRAYLCVRKMKLQPGRNYLINVGSVGQPRDGDSRACYGIYDGESRRFEFRRVTYDIEAAQKKILDAGLSPILAARLKAAM
ncbi:MAG: metallophosphoesterase family protein [Verrucomicrobiia bacterium]